MSYLVTATFDIVNAASEDYECIDKKFKLIGLSRTLQGTNSKVELPYNTYAGEFNGASAGQVRDDVADKTQTAMKSCTVKGKLFVTVGGDWAWGSRMI